MGLLRLLPLLLLSIGCGAARVPSPRPPPSPLPSPSPAVLAYPVPAQLPTCKWNSLYGQCEISQQSVLQQGLVVPPDGPARAVVRAAAALLYCRTLQSADCSATPACEFFQPSATQPGSCRASPVALVSSACANSLTFQYESCQMASTPALCRANMFCTAGPTSGDCNATVIQGLLPAAQATFMNDMASAASDAAGCCGVSLLAHRLSSLCQPSNGTCPAGCDSSQTDYGDYQGEPLQCKVTNQVLFPLLWGPTTAAAATLVAQDAACGLLSNLPGGPNGNCNGALAFPVVPWATLKQYSVAKLTGGVLQACTF